jgi:hypothetical protein
MLVKATQSSEINYSMLRDSQNCSKGFFKLNITSKPNIIWSYKTNDYIGSSPAVVEGKVYVGSGDGKRHPSGQI